jgi:glycerol uptake facilitator-like aquaporin
MISYMGEFVGTFVFVLIILLSIFYLKKFNQSFYIPLFVAIGLFVGIIICLAMGGVGHLNPAVSTMSLVKGDLTFEIFGGYVLCQLIGAVLAFFLYKVLLSNKML